jgi:hypothetical protein
MYPSASYACSHTYLRAFKSMQRFLERDLGSIGGS